MMNFKRVNHEDCICLLVRKLVAVADRDDIPELQAEIIGALESGRAHLFVGNHCGAVLEPIIEEGQKQLFVSFGWSENGHGIDDYIDAYELLANDIGAEKIVTLARRPGVLRLWSRHGFRKVGYNEQGLIKIEKDLRR